jgi:hypothetical protein
MSQIQYNLGRVLPSFKGEYNASTTYLPLDIVYYLGGSYVCKQNAQNKVPTNTTYWQIVAMKGELSPTLSPEQEASIINQIEQSSNFVVDADYVHTDNNFSDVYKNAVENLPTQIGSGVVSIMRNNTLVGSFDVNSTSNHSINIQVPTSISELTGDDVFLRLPYFETNNSPVFDIPFAKPGIFYYSTVNINTLNVTEVPTLSESFKSQPTIIEFTTGSSITINLPSTLYYDFDPSTLMNIVQPNGHYRFTIEYNVLRIQQIYKI